MAVWEVREMKNIKLPVKNIKAFNWRFKLIPLIHRYIFKKRDCKQHIIRSGKRSQTWNRNLGTSHITQSLTWINQISMLWQYHVLMQCISSPSQITQSLTWCYLIFLWAIGPHKGVTKVAMCMFTRLTSVGDLGLRHIKMLNTTFITCHLWNLATKKETLWVKWVHRNYLKSDSIWTVHIAQQCLWCLQSILNCRKICLPMISYRIAIGNPIEF